MFSLYEKSQRSNKYTKTSEAGQIHRKSFPVLGPTAQGKERKRYTAGATPATPLLLLEVRSHIHDYGHGHGHGHGSGSGHGSGHGQGSGSGSGYGADAVAPSCEEAPGFARRPRFTTPDAQRVAAAPWPRSCSGTASAPDPGACPGGEAEKEEGSPSLGAGAVR